ncbi:MAG: AzlC family ABC transporter permease [Enterobacteriaceae bacterium]
MLPLCLAVLPWGILAGSMAVQAGLTFWQSVAMSAIIYAGAAQLVTLGMLMTGASALTIIISVFFITAQHFLYALTLRDYVSLLHSKYRLPIGFLLTDELFALSSATENRKKLSPAWLIGAGLAFYLSWVLFSLVGIVMASAIPDLQQYHLDFSIVATFITIVVPMIKRISVLCGVLFSLLASILLSYLQVGGAIVIAGVCGMFFSVLVARVRGEQE